MVENGPERREKKKERRSHAPGLVAPTAGAVLPPRDRDIADRNPEFSRDSSWRPEWVTRSDRKHQSGIRHGGWYGGWHGGGTGTKEQSAGAEYHSAENHVKNGAIINIQ